MTTETPDQTAQFDHQVGSSSHARFRRPRIEFFVGLFSIGGFQGSLPHYYFSLPSRVSFRALATCNVEAGFSESGLGETPHSI
jgi:hypothetical protein